MNETHDVTIVGAGPVGLSLALSLARAGRSVLVLEKEPSTAEHSRAPAIWPRTQEILADLGVIDRFLDCGIVVPRLTMWNADRDRPLLEIPLEELHDETAYPHLLIVPQSTTERMLAEALREHDNANLRFSAEVTGVEQREAEVETTFAINGNEEKAHSRYVIGCDGAHSTIRKEALGASFDGLTYPIKGALADVVPEVADDFPFPRISTSEQLVVAIRIQPRVWRLILPYAASDTQPLDERVRKAVDRVFPSPIYEPIWQSEFTLHRRVSSKFSDRRIAIAGDAAHLNSPVGGQGMNAGIQDTVGLSQAILQGLESDDSQPFEQYDADRRQEIRTGVNRFTNRLTRLLLVGNGRLVKPILRTASLAFKIKPIRRRVLRQIAMLSSD